MDRKGKNKDTIFFAQEALHLHVGRESGKGCELINLLRKRVILFFNG